jgi:hypothetical protein
MRVAWFVIAGAAVIGCEEADGETVDHPDRGGLLEPGNACEQAAARITAKYLDCDIDIATAEDTVPNAECTDEAAALSTCYADCTEAVACEVLQATATTTTGLTDYAACLGDCVASGT